MNQGNNSQNNNSKSNATAGPSSQAPNTLNERPTNNKSGSFQTKKDGPNMKSRAGKWALDKAANLHPALKAAKAGLDAKDKDNNPLSNIRAKKGPQRNPNASANNSSRNNTSPPKENPRNSLLPKESGLPKPNILDDDLDVEENEGESSINTLRSMIGRGRKKISPLTIMGFGSIQIKLAVLPIVVGLVLFITIIAAILPGFKNSGIESIGVSDSNEEFGTTEEQKQFQERVRAVQDELAADGKNFDAKLIGAVLVILNTYGDDYDYDSLSENDIKEIANLMFDDSNNYSEEVFKNNLINDYFPSKISGKDSKTYERYVEEMFRLLDAYNDSYNNSSNNTGTGATGGACTYDIKGMNTEKYGTGIKNENMTITNLMVRLMSDSSLCDGTSGIAIPNEELVPFEKYVLGVAYAEVGLAQAEAFKTQLIVARSFALTVPAAAGNGNGKKLSQENGQWILQITNCVSDQVYCDPDKGCSKNVPSSNQYGVMYSGSTTKQFEYKPAIPQDSPYREYANEVAGKIPLDAEGRLYMTNFRQAEQTRMANLAKSGYDYTQIIMNIFPNVKSISESNCTELTTGDYRSWKQTDQTWSSVVLGGGTDSTKSIGNIGCLATSVAMLVAKSGALTMLPAPTLVTSDTFNPGTFVEALNKSNGFDSAGNFQWNAVGRVIPKFRYQDSLTSELAGMSKENKFNTIKSKVNADKTYCVAEVKGGQGEHWVALDSIEGNTIKMLDPGSNATDLWKEYDWNRTSRINCFTTN